nr:olfactory receptor 29 [Gregopimpla kuwanae]
MDIFQSRFYRANKTLLSFIGLWPYQKHKTWRMFQQFFCPFFVISVITPQLIKLKDIWGDMDVMVESLTAVSVQMVACIKFFNGLFHQKAMKKLLDNVKRDWSSLRNKKEIEILTQYGNEGRNLTILHLVFIYSATFGYLMIPLMPTLMDIVIPLNESRGPVYLYQSEYFVDPDEYFLLITLHTYLASLMTMTIIIAVDTMFICSVIHVCGILALIGHRLENLLPKRSDRDFGFYKLSKADHDRCHQEIVLCIDHHFKVTEVAKNIESSYSMSYLLVLGISMVCLSLSGVQLLIKFGQIEEMVRLFQFNLGQCSHLLFNSWPCQRLIDESVRLRESIYAAEWYSLSEENKRLLRFVMLRILNPLQITAGKLYLMSIENFGLVIKTSMSYFTVFASIR